MKTYQTESSPRYCDQGEVCCSVRYQGSPTLHHHVIEGRGETVVLLTLTGSHLYSLTRTDCPFLILHTIPLRITSLALKILFHAYDPMVDSLASKIEQFGKNLALNTQWHSKSRLFIMCHTCLARRESLNFSISLKPIPPISFASYNFFQLTQ